MALQLVRSLLYLSLHPLQTAQQCYDSVFTSGSCAVREAADTLGALSSRSLTVAAIGPALLDVLHSPAAAELCASAVGLVKGSHSLLQSEHTSALLAHLLGLLRSPACAEVVEATTSLALAFIRLCQTEQMKNASARTAQAIHALQSDIHSTPPPSPCHPHPLPHSTTDAWVVDSLVFLLRLRAGDGCRALSVAEMEAAVRLVRVRDVRLREWWVRREARGEPGSAGSREAGESREYRLRGEHGSSEEDGNEANDRVAVLELRRLLAAADRSPSKDGSCF